MKTTPTETDREAAQLFAPSGGMRAAWRGERNGVRPVWERLRDGSEATPDFYDTDDPATVGCMVAQVEAAAGAPVELWHCPDDPPDAAHVVFVRDPSFESFCSPTRGAALVAAKRALAEAPK